MDQLRKLIRGSLLLAGLTAALAFPSPISAAPSSSHAIVAIATAPDRPVVGQDTRVIVTLRDRGQQPIANASVLVRVEMLGTGMAGMNHGGPATAARPSAQPGEYVATLRLSDVGDWRITATSGDSGAEIKVSASKAGVPASAPAPAQAAAPVKAPSTAPPPPAPSTPVKTAGKPSSMEAVHASYLELVGNIADLRARFDLWKKGDADSAKIAEEKRERIAVVLASITWPDSIATAVLSATKSLGPMAKALTDKNLVGAESAAQSLGDASHDVTHAFYGDWLPSIGGIRFSPMAPHAIYLDLSGNIADLRSRVSQWQAGDEGSLNIAKEKSERIAELLPHLATSGMLLKPVQAIEKGLPAVDKALARKDVAAAQEALKPVADASHDLTHDFYAWLAVSSGGTDAACVLAAYRDLTLNVADLRTRIGQWAQGSEDSYNIAKEKLERGELVLAHPTWPGEMSAGIAKTEAALKSVADALKRKDSAAAEAAAKTLGDASHDVTHEYFADWLPKVQLGADEGQIAVGQGKTVAKGHDDGHGGVEGATDGPSYYFVGSTLGAVLLTILMVPILRRREARTPVGESGQL